MYGFMLLIVLGYTDKPTYLIDIIGWQHNFIARVVKVFEALTHFEFSLKNKEIM